jgi:hypothetical protein
MANYIGFDIIYSTQFSTEAVQAVVGSLIRAVDENWSSYHGPRDRAPFEQGQIENWSEAATPNRMEHVPEELTDETFDLFTETLDFRFSPFSNWASELTALRTKDGALAVTLRVCSKVRSYDPEPDLGPDATLHWPRNRGCLRHIFDALRQVLPIHSASIDPEIAEVDN